MVEPITVQTFDPSILLRQLVPEDAGTLFRLIDRNREQLSQYGETTAAKYPDEASVLRSITHQAEPGQLRFGIWVRGELAGFASLTPAHPLFSGSGQIGYWIGKEYEGQGIMKTAASALVYYAQTRLSWYVIFGYTHRDNRASQRVLYRAGLRYAGEQNEAVVTMVGRLRG